MRIGIDITAIIYDRGVSHYTSNLVRALAERPDVELRMYGASWRQMGKLQRFVKSIAAVGGRNKLYTKHQFELQMLPPKVQEFLWNTLKMNPITNVFFDLEVFHSWDWLQPPDKNLPLVSTIHDLAILKFPETAHPKILKMHQKSWEVLKKRRAQIIAVSQATKKDIVELLGFRSQDVHVVYEALPAETVSASQKLDEESYDQLKEKLQLSRPFLLCVGTREPRKNLKKAIEAWWPLRNQVDLYVAGEAGWDDTGALADQLRAPQLRFLGKVSNQELAVLYAEAELLLYPSLYEGFGLPILESFHFGTPVVTSNISSMPEVAGNAAELVDPHSVESIRAGISTILNEDVEQQRRRLQKMIIRLQQFTWKKVAEETVRVYRRAIQLSQEQQG